MPGALPRFVLPPLAVLPPLIIPAFSLAFVGLVQGATISKGYVNPDGKYPNASGDFVGQGVANIVAGLFQGMPVGAPSQPHRCGGQRRRQTLRFASNIFAGIVTWRW
ncbi:MAG: SulP family inorganic anion transporter [Caldilineales bacterium]